jgi:hypothetical protein
MAAMCSYGSRVSNDISQLRVLFCSPRKGRVPVPVFGLPAGHKEEESILGGATGHQMWTSLWTAQS